MCLRRGPQICPCWVATVSARLVLLSVDCPGVVTSINGGEPEIEVTLGLLHRRYPLKLSAATLTPATRTYHTSRKHKTSLSSLQTKNSRRHFPKCREDHNSKEVRNQCSKIPVAVIQLIELYPRSEPRQPERPTAHAGQEAAGRGGRAPDDVVRTAAVGADQVQGLSEVCEGAGYYTR